MTTSGKNTLDLRAKTWQKLFLSLSARIFLLRSLNLSKNMGATFQNYIYISGPHDDLLKIISELNFVKKCSKILILLLPNIHLLDSLGGTLKSLLKLDCLSTRKASWLRILLTIGIQAK